MIKLTNIFFKVCRKIVQEIGKAYLKMRIHYFYFISSGRICIDRTLIAGSGFKVSRDITEDYITIHPEVRVRNYFNITIGHGGRLSIGKNCFFNNHCSINCISNIVIGDNCQFGEQVLIYDHNHNYSDRSKLISEQGFDVGHVRIGNNCWIGSNVVILKGVKIGDNVVIGAGCVIHKSIDSGSIVYNQQNLTTKLR